MEVVDNLSKQMERMSIERDDARNAAEQRKVKVSKEYKIKEFNRMKQQVNNNFDYSVIMFERHKRES